MKFNTTKTKGGYKILSLHGPDGCDEYAGIVDTGGSYLTITWYDTGVPVSANELYSLIPLDEPKPDHKIEARIEYLKEKDKKNDMRFEALEGRLADFLSNQLYVQEKLDSLERELVTQEKDYLGRFSGLVHRVEAYESRLQEAESFAADTWQRLRHVEDGLSKRVETLENDTDGTVTNLFDRVNRVEYDLTSVRDQLQRTNFVRRIETLELDNKKSNTWGSKINGDLHEMHNRILKLERKTADTSDYHNLRLQIQDVEKQLEALEQRTKTDEKGVWVSKRMLEMAFQKGLLETRSVTIAQHDYIMWLDKMAKRLGLEE